MKVNLRLSSASWILPAVTADMTFRTSLGCISARVPSFYTM